jgi:hypothetical protein
MSDDRAAPALSDDRATPALSDDRAAPALSDGRVHPAFREVVEAGLVVRWTARILSATVAAILGVWRGPSWAAGVLVGGVLVEINLTLMIAMVRGARPGPLKAPLWLTVVKFNLAFVGTMVACVLVVKFRVGHPLAFLIGLGVFLPSVIVGLFRYGSLRSGAPAPASAASPPSTSPPSSPAALASGSPSTSQAAPASGSPPTSQAAPASDTPPTSSSTSPPAGA